MKNPRNQKEWQEAVDLAHFHLLLESARQYGLVEGGPCVNVERCEQLLAGGRQLGLTPRQVTGRLVEEMTK